MNWKTFIQVTSGPQATIGKGTRIGTWEFPRDESRWPSLFVATGKQDRTTAGTPTSPISRRPTNGPAGMSRHQALRSRDKAADTDPKCERDLTEIVLFVARVGPTARRIASRPSM